ncbi:hypothetical protein [Shigella flexneri]|nr:hypothetical protein [Shigella flexneri]
MVVSAIASTPHSSLTPPLSPVRTTPSVAEQEGHLMEMEATQAP